MNVVKAVEKKPLHQCKDGTWVPAPNAIITIVDNFGDEQTFACFHVKRIFSPGYSWMVYRKVDGDKHSHIGREFFNAYATWFTLKQAIKDGIKVFPW